MGVVTGTVVVVVVERLIEQRKTGVDQSAVVMLLSLGFPGDQQQQPREQPANRGGRRGESRAWVAKAHVESHVDPASCGGEVEGGIPTSGPNIQKLCQGSLDKVVVGHLEVEGLEEDQSESKRVVIFIGKSDIRRVGDGCQ